MLRQCRGLTRGRTAYLVALEFVVAASGCGSEPSSGDLAHLRAITLGEELWRVGRFDGPEQEVFGSIGGASFSGAGLVVSDSHSGRIHWYDEAGRYLHSAGAKGRGPGEFVAVQGLDVLSDGTVAAVNLGGATVEFFGPDGEAVKSVRFPGSLRQACVMNSTLVVLGVVEGSDAPLHLFNGPQLGWTAVGATEGPDVSNRYWRNLIAGLIDGRLACLEDRIVYARSSDGTVRLLERSGSQVWEAAIPDFVAMAHEVDGERGVRHGPAEGAKEMHAFAGVLPFGDTLAVQVWRADLATDEVSLYTVFVDVTSGRVLGRDESLPELLAVAEDRVAVKREQPVPSIAVFSITRE